MKLSYDVCVKCLASREQKVCKAFKFYWKKGKAVCQFGVIEPWLVWDIECDVVPPWCKYELEHKVSEDVEHRDM
jgi:hypothetical protein